MAGEVNVTEVASALVPLLIQRFGWAITLLQAVGIVFVAYVIYYVWHTITTYKNRKRIKDIDERLNSIEHKLDRLLRKK